MRLAVVLSGETWDLAHFVWTIIFLHGSDGLNVLTEDVPQKILVRSRDKIVSDRSKE